LPRYLIRFSISQAHGDVILYRSVVALRSRTKEETTMSSRKRYSRSIVPKRKRRALCASLENLEARLVLSQPGLPATTVSPTVLADPKTLLAALPPGPASPAAGLANGAWRFDGLGSSLTSLILPGELTPEGKPVYRAVPQHLLEPHPSPGSFHHSLPQGGSGPNGGLTPRQLAGAYGASNIFFGTTPGTGAGQTIALVDAGDNPDMSASLQFFDSYFGLPNPPSFQKFNQYGGSTLPGPISGWTTEIALDVEWAHAMAPGANIDLVEASSSSFNSLMTAANTAATTLGASVVSMSFGFNFDAVGESSYEQYLDNVYIQPALATNPGVTFLASTGDHGADKSTYGIIAGPLYPSVSPSVVAVGGTTLNVTGTTRVSETGWSYGSDSFAPSAASGGGYSAFDDPSPGPNGNPTFPEPAYQESVQFSGARTTPDVSSEADPATGVALYDLYSFGGWIPGAIGGTSLSSPTWAGFIAISDQGHQLLTGSTLNGPNQTLPALYALQNYETNYFDITVGNNYFSAGPGYDLVTGIGSPQAQNLIPTLAALGTPARLAVSAEPPIDVVQNGYFGTIGQIVDSLGNPVSNFSGNATISLASGPSGASFTPFSVPVTNGVAVFDQIQLSVVSTTTPYIFDLSATSGTQTFSVETLPTYVNQAATSGTGVFYPLPLDSSIHFAVNSSDSNDDAINIINLVYPSVVITSQLDVNNSSSLPGKTLTIQSDTGDGQVATAARFRPQASIVGDPSRLFLIQGTSSLNVFMFGFSLSGGVATDDGGLPVAGNPALGGALLIDGGNVTLSHMDLVANVAQGAAGAAGSSGAAATAGHPTGGTGGKGGAGGAAAGGAIYLYTGNLTLTSVTLQDNRAEGGAGGRGGKGGNGFTHNASGVIGYHSGNGGAGGQGGAGGSAAGGAIYVASGTLGMENDTLSQNAALGGFGGDGGAGGRGGFFTKSAGNGGNGGKGGNASGGALYVAVGVVSLRRAT
jgi:hypothetical protein